jgi:undecaprenyl-diphosphatase
LPGDLVLTRLVREAGPEGLLGFLLARAADGIWLVPPLAILFTLVSRRWPDALFLYLAAFTAVVVGEGIKAFVARPRPAADLVRAAGPPEGYGFPSVTTLFSVVSLGVICYLVWQARTSRSILLLAFTVSLLMVLATGLSRVYSGEHWASDVVGGWLFGGAWLLVMVAAYRWFSSRWTTGSEAGDPTRRRRPAPR